MIWTQDNTYSLSVPAFTDSIDVAGGYARGICGEKIVTLDSSAPSYLSISLDSVDPIMNPFMIEYDESLATEANIGVHSISYTVSFAEYSGIATDLTTETFTFEITCPTSSISYSEDAFVSSTTIFDLLEYQSESITLPTLSSSALSCFSVVWKV